MLPATEEAGERKRRSIVQGKWSDVSPGQQRAPAICAESKLLQASPHVSHASCLRSSPATYPPWEWTTWWYHVTCQVMSSVSHRKWRTSRLRRFESDSNLVKL